MQVKQYSTVDTFLKDNLSFLEEQEAVNNLLIGIPRAMTAEQEQKNPPNLFSVFEGGRVFFSCVQTPPKNFLIYGNIDSAAHETLIPALAKNGIQASGVIGSKDLAIAFAEAWKKQTGQDWRVNFRQLVYQLDDFQEVKRTDGYFRKATTDDLEIVEQWFIDFAIDAMNRSNPEEARALAKSKTESGMLYLWEDEVIVSMAAVARPTRNGITVNYVYTPPEYRGKGYASNCVAALSKQMLEYYQFCSLFTDMSNPTSNRIYQNMGYYPIAEFREISFL